MSAAAVRRVRTHEWREVRDLRVEAVSDPDAAIAFLSTRAEEDARDEAFWRRRAAGGALGDDGAQFVAEVDGAWIATATVLVRAVGSHDHLGRDVAARRADVVGVYVAPAHRGSGLLGDLVEASAAWAADRGVADLTLDVHAENHRARAAYGKLGFTPTGDTWTSSIGPELEMRRSGSRIVG